MDLAEYQPQLDWVASQQERMLNLIELWSNCNTGSSNLEGLHRMASHLEHAFHPLGTCTLHELPERRIINEVGEEVSIPVGPALTVSSAASKGPRVLLSGHMDTVFDPESAFQSCRYEGEERLVGPGVIDLKGGLVLILIALEALARSPWADRLSWQVVVNPDEEVGSPSSTPLLTQLARDHDVALVFEPPYPDGSMVSARKGSAIYVLQARGTSAHAGRAFHEGVNAITALARTLVAINALNDDPEHLAINIGTIRGGTAVNVVPDHAMAQVGVRATSSALMAEIDAKVNEIVESTNHNGSAKLTVQRLSLRPPKPFDQGTKHLFTSLQSCAQLLNQTVSWRSTGGVCDGNTLAAAGIPVIDTLGAPGGDIHTENEYLSVKELVPRAQLVTLYLLTLANRAWTPLPPKGETL